MGAAPSSLGHGVRPEGRYVQLGYNIKENRGNFTKYPLPDPPQVDPSFKVELKPKRQPEHPRRTIEAVSTGYSVVGVALPRGNDGDIKGLMKSNYKRIGNLKKGMSSIHKILFPVFVRNWVRKNLKPLARDTDVTLETYLDKTHYTLSEKDRIRETVRKEEGRLTRRNKKPKCFKKEEPYDTYKYFRSIFARPDGFKALVGPIFKCIEEELFKLKYFIKKIPRDQWAKVLVEMEDLGVKFSTDYTAFESHFDPETMKMCEFLLYDYMTQDLPDHEYFMRLIDEVLAGENICEFKFFTLTIKGRRMSGEMNTSLGNSFFNLMVLLYVFWYLGVEKHDEKVEGDDGAVTASNCDPDEVQTVFTDMGLDIKVDVHREISKMSFCGMVFHPRDLINITDPMKACVKMSWAMKRYARARTPKLGALASMKALSYIYQYPGCPVVTKMALWVLRKTKHYDYRSIWKSLSMYEREMLHEALARKDELLKLARRKPPQNTRILMHEVYGVSPTLQKTLEKEFDYSGFDYIDWSDYKFVMPPVWEECWNRYVVDADVHGPDIEGAYIRR